jgi:acyl carrier protein
MECVGEKIEFEGIKMETVNVEKQLIGYFKEKSDTAVDSKTLLLEEKIIDSMGVMELIAFIESNFGVEFTDDDLTVDNFKTIDSIMSVIMSKAGEIQ